MSRENPVKKTTHDGLVLRTWREEFILTVKEAAERVGISASYLYRIEDCTTAPPKSFLLHKFMELYGGRTARHFKWLVLKIERDQEFKKKYLKKPGRRRNKKFMTPEAIALRELRNQSGLSLRGAAKNGPPQI